MQHVHGLHGCTRKSTAPKYIWATLDRGMHGVGGAIRPGNLFDLILRRMSNGIYITYLFCRVWRGTDI